MYVQPYHAIIDAIKCVCEYLQNQISSCISPLNFNGGVLSHNRPLRQVLFEKGDSADPTIDLEPKHVGACAELKLHVVSARDFCFEKEEKNSFWRGNK